MNKKFLFIIVLLVIIILISILALYHPTMNKHKYLLVPVVESPYYRIGPKQYQDWYRLIEQTIQISRELQNKESDVTIAILSNFHPKGKPSEIDIYKEVFTKLAPELDVRYYKETYNTSEQVERSFELQKEFDAELVFISAWMHYPRVLYHVAGRKSLHYAVFGIPHPVFTFLHPLALVVDPIVDTLGLTSRFDKIADHEREQGKIL